MMTRINLLPKEVLEKRKAEGFTFLAVGGGVLVIACLVGLYTFNLWRIGNAEDELAGLKQQVAKMNTTIQELRVYEARVNAIEKQKQIAAKALEGKRDWSKVLTEVMVVTPNDVALETLEGNPEGVKFTGKIDDPADKPDTGHKQVAKWLIRLGELKFQPKTWLTSSTKEDVDGGVTTPGRFISFENTMNFKEATATPTLPNGN